MLDTRIFVNFDQIASIQCLNISGKADIAHYKVSLCKAGEVKECTIENFERSRGALELIHDAIEALRDS